MVSVDQNTPNLYILHPLDLLPNVPIECVQLAVTDHSVWSYFLGPYDLRAPLNRHNLHSIEKQLEPKLN